MVPSHRNQAAKEAVGTERCCLGWRVRLITQQRQYRHAWRGDHCPCPHAPFLLPVSQCQLNSADLATCLIPSSCHARQGLERNTAGANALTFLNQKLTYQLSEKKERNSEILRLANIIIIITAYEQLPFRKILIGH